MDAFAPAVAGVLWVHLVALELAAGALLFLILAVRPRCRAPEVWARIVSDSRRPARVLAMVAGITLFAWLWLTIRDVLDDPSHVSPTAFAAFLSGTQFGRLWLIRLLLLLIASLPLWSGRAARLFLGCGHLAASLALLVSLAFAGHAAAGHGAGSILVHAIHLTATAAWVGSLPPLALLLHRAEECGGDWAELAVSMVRSYAVYGSVAVLALLGSGVALAAILAGGGMSWADDYSRTLMVKLALFGLMGLLGLANRSLLTRRVLGGERRALRAMRAVTLLELALALAVLFLAAVLSQTSPP